MSTSKVSTPQDRIDVRIPKSSKIYRFLYVDTDTDKAPKWQRLDAILALAEQNKEEFVVKIYDDFVTRMSIFYPESIEALNKLRPLIIKHILKGDPLDESYYKIIQELCS